MWELAVTMFDGRDITRVNNFLKEGFEPFAVTADQGGWMIWLRKEVDEICNQQPKPVKGTGRRAAGKSKEKDSS